MKTDHTRNDLTAIHEKTCWQNISLPRQMYSTISTGFAELDSILALGGWPLETTTELATPHCGIGELRLLMPALQHLMNDASQHHIIWINPPYLPYAPALIKEGIDPTRIIIVRTKNVIDTLWAAEQTLLSQSCAAVFTWTDSYKLSQKESRRLQLAVEKSNTWHVQFRHSDCLQQASAARLRLELQNNALGELDIKLCKQPQGAANQRCTLSLAPHYELWRRIPANLLPQHNTPLAKSAITQPRPKPAQRREGPAQQQKNTLSSISAV